MQLLHNLDLDYRQFTPPSQQKCIPIFVPVSTRTGRIIARGIVILAACLALPGFVVAIFAAVASPHAVAVCGAESTWYPFAFDCRHQMVDAEIGLGAFVRGEAAGGSVTVAAAGCRCRLLLPLRSSESSAQQWRPEFDRTAW